MPDRLFEPPYYAVIFTSTRSESDDAGYGKMAEKMATMAAQQPGYLGVESSRDPSSGVGITVSYWRDLESIRAWKLNIDHTEARNKGRETWYKDYALRIAKVEREYNFSTQ